MSIKLTTNKSRFSITKRRKALRYSFFKLKVLN
jgi:hypothetical protein